MCVEMIGGVVVDATICWGRGVKKKCFYYFVLCKFDFNSDRVGKGYKNIVTFIHIVELKLS